MPLFAIPFPAIDPVAIAIGPFAIRWYALAYIVGLLIGWRYCLRLADGRPQLVTRVAVDDFLVWATLGVVLGGRLGYVLFYNFPYYREHPLQALYLWRGGMSFHGGAIGVTLAIWLFTRARAIPVLAFGDIICEAIPIGLFFGRIANFINGELYGRFADVAWAIIYPAGAVPATTVPTQYRGLCQPVALMNGPGLNCPRHPSELYEAICEGILLFLLLFLAERCGARRHPGLVSGLFLTGYAVARMSGELFRQPDAQLGFLLLGMTMGQLLSLPLLIGGIALVLWSRRRPAAAAAE